MRLRLVSTPGGIVTIVFIFLLVIQLNKFCDYFSLVSPGICMPLSSAVEVHGGVKDSKGTFLLTAVMAQRANPFSLLYGMLDQNIDIVMMNYTPGDLDAQEAYRKNMDIQMKESEGIASAVALRYLGRGVGVDRCLNVLTVESDSPFYLKIMPGDRILWINDRKVATSDDIRMELKGESSGALIKTRVQRGTRTLLFTSKLIRTSRRAIPYLGIDLVQNDDFQLPIDIDYNPGDVKGSSAGVMFALEVYDQLSRIDITKGRSVAGTGTLQYDGSVDEVSAVKQKVIAAKRAGADLFISPKGNYQEAKKYAGDMKVIAISSFSEAIKALQ